ncbi:MAG: DUF3025 domain-containing protein [Burkholderiales bacterium]
MASAREAITTHVSWEPERLLAQPILGSMRSQIAKLSSGGFPDLAALNALARSLSSASGAPIRFVPPLAASRSFEEHYEVRVYRQGTIGTRACNWHDLFNALVWLSFPNTKATLNARHYEEISRRPGNPLRGTARDVLTLFDEGGVFVASASGELSALLRAEHWKDLFWGRRADVKRWMRFFVFGHAIMEKALSPYAGITAKALIVDVDDAFLHADDVAQRATLDQAGVSCFAGDAVLQSTRSLAPLPILGIPGWTPDNESPDYYEDIRQFRPPRNLRGRADT